MTENQFFLSKSFLSIDPVNPLNPPIKKPNNAVPNKRRLSFSKPISSAILFGSSESVLIEINKESAIHVKPNPSPELTNDEIFPAPTKKEMMATPIIKIQ